MSDVKLTPFPTEKKSARPRISSAGVLFGLMFLFSLLTAFMILLTPDTQPAPPTTNADLSSFRPPDVLNRPAPAIELRALDDSVVQLADYSGKVVFLNFWYSGCPPCVEELPDLEAFAQAQAGNDVVVLGVNNVDTPERIQAFLSENGIMLEGVEVLLDVPETSYAATRGLGVSVYPTTYIIDADQNIKNVKFGVLTAKEMDTYLSEVRQLSGQ